MSRRFAASAAFGQTAPPAPAPIITNAARFLPVVARNGMVAAQEKHADARRRRDPAAGGNAVDAAVAVGFAMAVTHPQAGNIGGGGFMLVHLAARNETIAIDYRETAPAAMTRDVFLDEKGEADPKKSRDSRARRRRARHGRGARARARALRLGQVHARATDRAGDRARARRLRGRGRSRQLAAARAAAPRALARLGEDFSQRRRRAAGARRHAGAGRACGFARDDRRRRTARVLRRPARREDRDRHPSERRHHDARRPEDLSRDRASRRARHLSRLRHRLDAAALLRRRPSHPDPQHPRRLSAARPRSGVGRDLASDDRGDEARLCGPRGISRRSGVREGAGRRAHLEALRRRAAQGDRSGARAAGRHDQARHAGRV